MAAETSTFFRPAGLPGVEALHASFVEHAYRPHSHPTWTIAVVERGAARFSLDATQQRADRGELFVLEPEAVHTGMAAVPEGWAYKVLYLEPELIAEWEERTARAASGRALGRVPRPAAARRAVARARARWPASRPGWPSTARCSTRSAALRPHLRAGPARAAAGPSTPPSAARWRTSRSAGTSRSRWPSSRGRAA